MLKEIDTIQKPQRIKEYKSSTPEDTIFKIRQILKQIGIFVFEEYTTVNYQSLFSSRIRIGNDKIWDLNIGTNGKGYSIKYSLASAYAEFIERLQNNSLFKDNFLFFASKYSDNSFQFEDLKLSFIEYPDEEFFSIKETLSNSIVQHLANLDKGNRLLDKIKNNKQLRIFTPFYNVFNSKVELLPILLMKKYTTSNGMCAGNTPKEAIIQGISEIMERYAIKKLYFNKIVPPDIPLELFEGTKIYEQIKLLEEKSGFKVIIKDCSLGLNLPVIGILLIDKNNNKYCFHLGADPSPITALERSLSELFQGVSPKKFKDIDLSINVEVDGIENNIFKNYLATITNGTGQWPKTIFSSYFTHEFTGFKNYISKNDDADLNYLFKLLKKLNYDVFIRDVSFLGFPSYYIYIPGMSENYEENFSIDNDLILTANNLLSSKKEDLVILAESIVQNKKIEHLLFYNLNYDLKELDYNLFLVMLYYFINDIKSAYLAIVKYLENNKDINDRPYFLCIRDFLWFKLKNTDPKETYKNLESLYETEIIEIVLDDFASNHEIFKHFQMPNCFNCNNCTADNACLMKDILKIVYKIQEHYKQNVVTQENLKNILKGEAENL